MSLPGLRRVGSLVLIAVAVLAGSAAAALVEVDDVVLRADGGFQPQSLPRHRYAPIEFHGELDLAAKPGRRLPPLRQALVDFDRDGRLAVAGLPACAPESIDGASPRQARSVCRGAIVGTGHVEARVVAGGKAVDTASALTVFNGPRLGGLPTAVLHARFAIPNPETYAILVPIEKLPGEFRYRARVDLPPLAEGYGALTHLDVEIGRRYRADGRERSYVSARCSDNILKTHGRFSFESGTVIDGLVEKYCHSK
jgi:hypothetical protein